MEDKKIFKEKGYKLIDLNFGYKNLIAKSFNECVRANNFLPTKNAAVSCESIDIMMESLAAIVHRDYTTSIVEKEIGLKLIPTYCYTRKYFQGSVLWTHTDRESCEISLTYCISGPEWKINMRDSALITKIGNGVIYKGCEVPHGRPEPSSGEVIQVFNHWVISGGVKSEYAYRDTANGITEDFYRAVNR